MRKNELKEHAAVSQMPTPYEHAEPSKAKSLVKKLAQAFFLSSKKSSKQQITQFSSGRTEAEYSGLEKAVQNGDLITTIALLKNNQTNRIEYLNNAIVIACKSGHLDLVALLLRHSKADPSFNNHAAIVAATKFNQLEVIKELLKHPKTDPSARSNLMLKVAILGKQQELIKILLQDERVKLFEEQGVILSLAVHTGNVELQKIFLHSRHARSKNAIQAILRCKKESPAFAKLIEHQHNLAVEEVTHAIHTATEEGLSESEVKDYLYKTNAVDGLRAEFTSEQVDEFLDDYIYELSTTLFARS